jgi:putative endonuclease
MRKSGSVYIMASVSKRILYVGVTSDLQSRAWKHKNKIYPDSFTAKYNCILLVYYRHFDDIVDAIAEEKRIKGGSRQDKERLINTMNAEWKDLYDCIEYP